MAASASGKMTESAIASEGKSLIEAARVAFPRSRGFTASWWNTIVCSPFF